MPAIFGFTIEDTLVAAFGDVWAPFKAMVVHSIKSPEAFVRGGETGVRPAIMRSQALIPDPFPKRRREKDGLKSPHVAAAIENRKIDGLTPFHT